VVSDVTTQGDPGTTTATELTTFSQAGATGGKFLFLVELPSTLISNSAIHSLSALRFSDSALIICACSRHNARPLLPLLSMCQQQHLSVVPSDSAEVGLLNGIIVQ